jgi:hypothetical protein
MQLWQWFLLLKVSLKGKGGQSCKHSTSQVDQAFITMTGFDHNSFTTPLQKSPPAFDDYTPFNKQQIELKEDPKKGGRPRLMQPEDCL